MNILFVPLHEGGHVHSMIGLAKSLQNRGHSILFLLDQSKSNLMAENEICLKVLDTSVLKVDIAHFFNSSSINSSRNPFNCIINYLSFYQIFKKIQIVYNLIMFTVDKNAQIESVIRRFKPDVIIVDDPIHHPAVLHCGKPWVNFWSQNPLCFIRGKDLPPGRLEYENSLLNQFHASMTGICLNILHRILFSLCGYGFDYYYTQKSPFLNFYVYPKELDYETDTNLKDKIFRIDASFEQSQIKNTKIHKYLLFLIDQKRDKKLILVSFGSFVSSDVRFMKRMISILSKSNHFFIVSKGPNSSSYCLSRNMIGDKSIEQMSILPMVDLVISHGGNNTFCEAIYFGKPMILIPFFGDQHDNASRIHDLKLGIRIKLAELDEKRLFAAIDFLIDNKDLRAKLSKISSRIQSDHRLDTASQMVENLKDCA